MKRMARLAARARGGLRRFYAAFLALWALFLLLSWQAFHEPTRDGTAAALALFFGAACAAMIRCHRERRCAAPFDRWQLLAAPAACAAYVLFRYGVPEREALLAAAGLSGACAAAGLWSLTRRAGEGAFAVFFTAFWKAVGTAALLTLSLSVCLLAADSLLWDVNWRWYTVAWTFSIFAVGGPLFLSWLPEERADAPHLLSVLFRRVLLPVYLVLLAILYGYIGKIALAWEMPVGQMNWFASLAVFGYALFYFLFPRAEGRVLPLFLRWGAAALLPVVAVQLLGVEIRVSVYGLTAARYASLLCTAFGIAVLVFGFFRRGRGPLFLLAAAFCTVASVGPMDLYAVPLRDQMYRAQTVMEARGMMQGGDIVAPAEPLAPEERERLTSARNYLAKEARRRGGETYTFADQIARSDVLGALAEEARTSGRDYRNLFVEGPTDIAGYRRIEEFNGFAGGGTEISMSGVTYDAGPALEALFAARPAGLQTEPMTWQADETHLVVFRRCTRIIEDGRTSYIAYGWILEK